MLSHQTTWVARTQRRGCVSDSYSAKVWHIPSEGRCLMARNTRMAHPAVSQQIEQMLKARTIDFDFEPNVQISEIRDTEGYQVRLTEHRAPKEQVAKYATAMKHGA